MSGIETPIPLPVLALWSLPAVGLLLLSHVRLSRAVPRRPCWAMTFLRGAALALVLALLLHPYRETREPDRDGFRVTALLDTSMSMAVTDLDGERERMTAVREAVAAPDSGAESPLQRLEDRYRLHLGAFAETVRTLRAGRPPPFMPGRTAVGDALDHALRDASPAPLGGVV
ncbi:MAG: hypothetical protein JXR77_15350, partial [Lentisphaeria bacterium]|nr:hypothetical protein [Lentisphaeria bacterium]